MKVIFRGIENIGELEKESGNEKDSEKVEDEQEQEEDNFELIHDDEYLFHSL